MGGFVVQRHAPPPARKGELLKVRTATGGWTRSATNWSVNHASLSGSHAIQFVGDD
jgi:hypothetical protein